MARARYSHTRHCEHPGCKEQNHRVYTSYREMMQDKSLQEPYRCLRHWRPEQVLSAENPVITYERFVYEKFWSGQLPDSSISRGSGYAHGPGFMAWAEDFPPGTKLIVTARVVLPEGENP